VGASCSSVADDASRASECIAKYVITGAYYAYYDGTYDDAYYDAYYDGTYDSAYYNGDAHAYYDWSNYAYCYRYCDYSHYRWPSNYSYGCLRVGDRGHPTAYRGPHHSAAAAKREAHG